MDYRASKCFSIIFIFPRVSWRCSVNVSTKCLSPCLKYWVLNYWVFLPFETCAKNTQWCLAIRSISAILVHIIPQERSPLSLPQAVRKPAKSAGLMFTLFKKTKVVLVVSDFLIAWGALHCCVWEMCSWISNLTSSLCLERVKSNHP